MACLIVAWRAPIQFGTVSLFHCYSGPSEISKRGSVYTATIAPIEQSLRWVSAMEVVIEFAREMMEDLESAAVEENRAEKLLVVERDLSLAISSSSSLNEVLDLLLTATCRIDGLDCGGVYLMRARSAVP